MPFLFGVIESVFNSKERLWHRMLINEILACFAVNVAHYLYLPRTEMSPGNILIHAQLIQEKTNAIEHSF